MSKKIIIRILIPIAVICLVNGIVNNYRIIETDYQISTDKVSEDYKFIHISDYHSNSRQDETILEITQRNNPDYILLSGDILESDDMSSTVEFVEQLTKIAPVVYARGNHDNQYGTYQQFQQVLSDMGVIVLNNDSYQTAELNFIGLEDIDNVSYAGKEFDQNYEQYISTYSQFIEDDKYNILLAHRPNYLEQYAELDADLVVSGHAHGGQWQIPFTDIGIIAPDEGLFPTHVEGLQNIDDTYQSISTGTSNPYGLLIPRFFNPEEVVVIELDAE